jgi:hypothetical protein
VIEEERTERIVVIGDLHLDPDPRGGPNIADPSELALRNLVEALAAETDEAAPRHLVLLGDLIDFDRVRHADPTAERLPSARAVDLLGATHAPFVEALRAAGRAGLIVHVVAGNHDPEWALPDVARRLRHLLGDEGSVEIHPWILRVAGRIHAEHGNNFHDVNAMPRPSQPFAPDSPGLHLGSVIDRWNGDVAQARAIGRDSALGLGVGAIRLLAAHLRLGWCGLGRLIALSAPSERRRRERYRDGELADYAREIGLRADAAAALDRVGQVEPLAMARRLAATLRHSGPITRGQALMRRGARRLDALLAPSESTAPLIVFAHSHVAEVEALGNGRWYANPGRWAPDVHGGYPYLAIEWNEGSLSVELLAWDDAARSSRQISIGMVDLGLS